MTHFSNKMLAEMPFQVTLATMLAHCKDSQHQVRGLSFANIGLVPSHIWQHCFCENFSTRSDDVTIFNEVVNALSAGAVDGIGTVREAALKAIGEVINNCSHLFPTVDLIRASASVNGLVREIHYMQILSSACLKGCKDTKLSVRIQSSWALGNLLSTMAPTRSMILETPPIHFQLQPRPFFWFDEYWVEIANTTLALANDSEKLVATTVRCWSLLLICLGISTESDVLVSAISERMSSMIYSNKSYDVHPLCPMEFYISNHHQKHLVAMSHAFNALFWYLSRNKGIGVDENRGTAYELLLTSENYVDLILGFQCKLLKYEGLNVRLVSLHSLLSIYGAVFSPTISRIFRTSILSAENIIR